MKNLNSIFVLFVITLLTALNAEAQTKVYIPDPNFRAFLTDTYPTFMDISGDSLIADSAATFTGTLDCNDRNIADLTGIEYFINIDRLFCVNNQLTILPEFQTNSELTYLNCSMNYLDSLPDLSANIKLSFLRCSENQLVKLPELSANTELFFLHCSNNQLATLPDFSTNPALTYLYCYDNQLSSLPDLSTNIALTDLCCGENQLTELPDLSTNIALTDLYCYDNQLSSLPDLSANIALTNLSCGENQLTELPDLSANIALTDLVCWGNQLVELPDLSANLALTNLDCYDNQLVELPDLSANIDLKFFACHENKLDFSDARELRIANEILELVDSEIVWFYYSFQNAFGDRDSILVNFGDTIVLSIAAQDSALSYQWFLDRNTVEGATGTMLIIENVTADDLGTYTCKSYGTALLSPPMMAPGISEFVSEPIVVYSNLTGLKPEVDIERSINIYPNPTNGLLNIQSELFACYELYNAMGILVTQSNELFVDFRDFEEGVYFIKLFDNAEKSFTKKVVYIK